ncbi:hypothetical protein CK203_008434 [Vitis vinifera]|uniref:Reverse transcriptase Ty1/copia-type domain-containing protein n=1 Tax=Vitis vinifera TaxID=29760 RepID=A0A438KP11_VITVI|nr:hypothetical protein CK203_008434 [Vitis vinifera]
MTIIIVYVDDIILARDYEEELCKLKNFLAKEFEIKDLGNLKYFIGMEIVRSKKGIAVSQRKYALDLSKRQGCSNASLQIHLWITQSNWELRKEVLLWTKEDTNVLWEN